MMAPRPPLVLAWVFPPGEYLRDEVATRGWTPNQFAKVLGTSINQTNELLNGRAALTARMGAGHCDSAGTSTDVWLALEKSCRACPCHL